MGYRIENKHYEVNLITYKFIPIVGGGKLVEDRSLKPTSIDRHPAVCLP
jgi:hypothetical protein